MKNFARILIIFFSFGGCNNPQKATQTSQTQIPANIGATGTNISAGNTKPAYKFAEHPRLFFSKGEELGVLNQSKNNDLLAQLIVILRKEADLDLNHAPQEYKPNTGLLHVSREQIRRLMTLSMAYRLFKDDKYAKKVEAELVNVCGFASWNPEHFLDVAEMTTAVSIGYDWCYDYLSPATRQIVETAILEKAFKPAWPIYASNNQNSEFSRDSNWNTVCNAGMVNGAIAIGDKYPQEAEQVIQYAGKYIPNILETFAPEGVFNEGPTYWSYNGMFMALLFDNLNRNLPTDFGLTDFKGLNNTAHFYMSVTGPSGKTFNFANASSDIDNSGTFFLFSKLYRQPEVAAFYRDLLTTTVKTYAEQGTAKLSRLFFLAIPWFDDTPVTNKSKEEKLTVFRGITDILVLNGSSTSDKNRLYVAAKSGDPTWAHNQLDVGSFVVDSEGQRWGIDLGADNYSLPGFWDYKPDGRRWHYFRNTNLAHNTISIDNKIAYSKGRGELMRYEQNNAQPFGIFDISSSYAQQASSVQRGFRLLDSNTVLVRDEVNLIPGSKKIAWRFLTESEVAIQDNTVTLTQNGKKFYLRCLLPNGFTTSVFKAKTNTPAEKPVKDVSIVEISVTPAATPIAIPVVMGRHLPGIQASAATKLALKDWK